MSFDGDADRCCFVDETGRMVPNDLMTALPARDVARRHPGARIVCDLRSSWSCARKSGRQAARRCATAVGHSFIKATMRAHKAVFGGELSGHFYFADNYTCDSGEIAFVTAASLVSRSERPLATGRLPGATTRAARSTSRWPTKCSARATAHALPRWPPGRVRRRASRSSTATWETRPGGGSTCAASNTEPLLRLNLEASDAALAQAKLSELIGLLGKPLAD
ncbi:MAG: hypothetical protein IPJ19_14310 [Planctomycetes bacterium]|nr:hypothetical protein [Planctomycetota bacterium]